MKADVSQVDYWQDGINKAISKVQDLTSMIDELKCEAYDLEKQREELLQEIKDYKDEIKSIERHETERLHEERLKTDMVYHAMHTPSQKRLVEG